MNSRILHTAFYTLMPEGFWGAPMILRGGPGSGKTAMIAAAAANMPAYERISPAERGEGQFGVVPVPGSDGLLHYPPPAWAGKFANGGVLFVDEINTAPPALQAPLLGLVQLRTLGSFVFPRRTRVIAAANETMDAAGGWDLSPALANRFGHFEFEGMNFSDWTTGLLGGFVTPHDDVVTTMEDEETRVLAAWPSAMASASGLVAGFIQRRPDLLQKRPEKASASSSLAWPSRRTVHYATCLLASAAIQGLNEIDTQELVGGFVGLAWMSEFQVWRQNLDLPDPAAVLDGKVEFKHDPRRLDRTLAVLGSCAALVTPEKAERRRERGNVAWKVISTVLKDAADVAIPAARAMVHAKMMGKDYSAWTDVGDRIWPLIEQSGITRR